MAENAKNELSERKKRILKAIVDAHIVDGEPVGSKYIMQDEHLNCSSATIRNEMAELEALGYLEQPHTSAGRVPSELGYRFYVDTLIESYAMTTTEIAEINKLLKSKMNELDQILMAASKLAGNLTNYTSFVIKPKASSVRIKRFDVIFVDRHSLLLVMISDGGAVLTKRLSIDISVSQMTASDLAAALNDHISGLTANEITLPIIVELEEAMGDKSGIVNPIIKIIYESMNELDGGDLKVSGMDRLLQYPEYSNKDQLRELLGALENKEDILDLVSEPESDGVNVVIGSESSVKVMNNSALVFKPVVRDGKTLGAIGIIGPRRMDYAKVVATIEGLAGNVESMLNDTDILPERNGGDENDGG
ncbi:MAG: heat-inducible transcription repressor HrcA [Clostridia bacterium]|nr:heat-inducible transcription repressor HrcA [Clostridia bacterium]